MMASDALIILFMPTVTSPTTPCISMKAKRARYIKTPGRPWDDTRDGDTLKRSVEPVACLDDDDADESRTCQRTNTETHVKTNSALLGLQVDKVAETNSDDTSHSNS